MGTGGSFAEVRRLEREADPSEIKNKLKQFLTEMCDAGWV
jgi:hypothetical protein